VVKIYCNFFSLLIFSGLCTILRSEAGGQEDAIAEGCEDDPAYCNNAHFLTNGNLSNHVAYYDAAALYPSSGTLLYINRRGGEEGVLGKEKEHNPTPFPPPSPPPLPSLRRVWAEGNVF
jgi:hypothetical protein